MNTFLEILYAAIILGIFSLGALVLLSNYKERINQIFAFISFAILGWIGTLIYITSSTPDHVLFYGRLNFVFGILALYALFLFSYHFPYFKRTIQRRLVVLTSAGWTTILSVLTLFTPVVITSEMYVGGLLMTEFGPLYFLFLIHTAVFLILFIALLAHKIKIEKEKLIREQLRYILFGVAITVGLVLITNVVFPLLGNFAVQDIGAAFTIILVGSLGYAISKFQLFSIRVMVAEVIIIIFALAEVMQFAVSDGIGGRLVSGLKLVIILFLGGILIRGLKQEKSLSGLASHQLRTPLTAIRGISSMLLDGSYGNIQEDIKPHIQRIEASASRMSMVIEDFLKADKLTSGKVKYEMDSYDIVGQLNSLYHEISMQAKAKSQEFTISVPPNAKLHAFGDKLMLRQVFQALMDNAVKYTPNQGKISVSLSVEKRKRHLWLKVDIKDTGAGIEEDALPKLFKKYSRSDSARMNTEGSGLGLFISKKIVKDHGGEIEVLSEGKDKGTTFTVRLKKDN